MIIGVSKTISEPEESLLVHTTAVQVMKPDEWKKPLYDAKQDWQKSLLPLRLLGCWQQSCAAKRLRTLRNNRRVRVADGL